MVIGVLTIDLNIDGAFSLKEKRMVLRRIRDRVRHRFNVSLAEVDGNQVWNYSRLGIAVVANQQKHANQVLSKVLELIETIRGCTVEDVETEFL